MTAALSYKTLDHEAPSAFLGVERSARGLRWVERLDPSRAADGAGHRASPWSARADRAACSPHAAPTLPPFHIPRSLAPRISCPTLQACRTWSRRPSASPAPSSRASRSPFSAITMSTALPRSRYPALPARPRPDCGNLYPRPPHRRLRPDACGARRGLPRRVQTHHHRRLRHRRRAAAIEAANDAAPKSSSSTITRPTRSFRLPSR